MMWYKYRVLRGCYKSHIYGELDSYVFKSDWAKVYYKNKTREWIKQTDIELDAEIK